MRFFVLLAAPAAGFVMQMNSPAPRRDFLSSAGALSAGALATGAAIVQPLPALAAVPAIGSPAPEFILPSNRGKDISLQELLKAGKRTVLYFYPGDFTQGCTIEAKGFEKDIDSYKKLNTQIVGVSVDSVDKHLDFEKTYGLEFPLLSDVGAAVADKYGAKLEIPFLGKFANRITFIISPDGKIEKAFTDVESKVAKHSEEVLQALQQLS